jgi:CheY-like chemotaxis protein
MEFPKWNNFPIWNASWDGRAVASSVKHRILVVDDDESVRELFVLMLRKEGYEVTAAEDGFDALLKLKRELPVVIISDLNMPKMSGFEFLSVVRSRFPMISVVASSGAYASRVVPTGVFADAFYAKGEASPRTLLEMVATLIQTSGAQASAHEDGPLWSDSVASRENLDDRSLHLRTKNCLASPPVLQVSSPVSKTDQRN